MAAPVKVRVFLRHFLKSNTKYYRLLSTESKTDEAKHKKEDSFDRSRQTHFGFETVDEEIKEQKVYEVFENVASKYDVMNDAMSVGVHRLWKDQFVSRLAPSPGTKLLDVAGGTGDIAFRCLKYLKNSQGKHQDSDLNIDLPRDVTAGVYMDPSEVSPSHSSSSSSSSSSESDSDHPESQSSDKGKLANHELITDAYGNHLTISDINQAMLDVGKAKAARLGYTEGVQFLQANAESLPLPDSIYDAYTIAFGIRNCTHIDKVLEEAYRVLKPGGRFMCLEFSEVKNPVLRRLYDTYSFQVIPVMGQVIAGDWKSYQYLVESIRQFPNQEAFEDMIKAAGFRMVSHENLTFGVAAIHSGFKI